MTALKAATNKQSLFLLLSTSIDESSNQILLENINRELNLSAQIYNLLDGEVTLASMTRCQLSGNYIIDYSPGGKTLLLIQLSTDKDQSN